MGLEVMPQLMSPGGGGGGGSQYRLPESYTHHSPCDGDPENVIPHFWKLSLPALTAFYTPSSLSKAFLGMSLQLDNMVMGPSK